MTDVNMCAMMVLITRVGRRPYWLGLKAKLLRPLMTCVIMAIHCKYVFLWFFQKRDYRVAQLECEDMMLCYSYVFVSQDFRC